MTQQHYGMTCAGQWDDRLLDTCRSTKTTITVPLVNGSKTVESTMKALRACDSISSSSTIPHASAAPRIYPTNTDIAASLLAYNKQMPPRSQSAA
ncbi:hypothetical protein BO83DRAFT_195093 [Aspergillus eucalypticola CBS 122712]|uniref:Uncharacterized protein n=1 Tax=Aspergillus eucalypticola (strain CBS 122712 / IBT 29274) TaxID=1448314 RepID=A0A317W3D9_ASPEC|nr:uncharacterized protein BO83DRAFT_195093 [Aspergillus eucalypticola CBS 122712]PWY79777.1 hypothetical protein BO83DRAFT_195093 [Aspergillus eucalypticola CBS 122712]